MTELSLKIVRADDTTVCEASGTGEVHMVFEGEYQEGDKIVLESAEKNLHLMVQVDDALGSALVYITENKIVYEIPFHEQKVCYSPKVFSGSCHYLSARLATEAETGAYRNLALNVMDQHGETHCYPHASANVETRGESVFAARNAIDGVLANSNHGFWPYASWGINRDPNACMKIEFGREVEVDKIVIYTRADFPHDSWWTQVTFTFSDGTSIDFPTEKSAHAQTCAFEKKRIRWVTIDRLIKADDPSPFPALTQMEVYGTECEKES